MKKNSSLEIVAIARDNNGTIFSNHHVVVHHPYSNCNLQNPRKIHRDMLLALNRKKILKKCSKCWTNKMWEKAFDIKERIKRITVDSVMKEIEKSELND